MKTSVRLLSDIFSGIVTLVINLNMLPLSFLYDNEPEWKERNLYLLLSELQLSGDNDSQFEEDDERDPGEHDEGQAGGVEGAEEDLF